MKRTGVPVLAVGVKKVVLIYVLLRAFNLKNYTEEAFAVPFKVLSPKI